MKITEARILFLGLNFPPEVTGIAPYSGSLAAFLSKYCQHIQVVTTPPHYPQWKVFDSSSASNSFTTMPRISVTRVQNYIPKSPSSVRRLIYELTFGILGSFSKWGHRDVILLVTPGLFSSAIFAARAMVTHRKSKVVVWVQDLYARGYGEINESRGLVFWMLGRVEAWLLKRADLVVAIHERFAEIIDADYGVDSEKVLVIRNWTHSKFSPTSNRTLARAFFGWPENQTVVLHVGNMGVKQGLDNVVRAARIAQERGLGLKFVLVGDGVERQRLKISAKSLSTIEFIDTLDSESFQNALAAADLFLLNELDGVSEMAVPSKLTTYFQAGKPVIASTDLRGISAKEIQLAGAGVAVKAGSPELLLDEIADLSTNMTLMKLYGSNGRAFALSHLSAEASHSKFLDAIEGLI
jgi:colanic acid biosynthesis glycosyl transferase WcaI